MGEISNKKLTMKFPLNWYVLFALFQLVVFPLVLSKSKLLQLSGVVLLKMVLTRSAQKAPAKLLNIN